MRSRTLERHARAGTMLSKKQAIVEQVCFCNLPGEELMVSDGLLGEHFFASRVALRGG